MTLFNQPILKEVDNLPQKITEKNTHTIRGTAKNEVITAMDGDRQDFIQKGLWLERAEWLENSPWQILAGDLIITVDTLQSCLIVTAMFDDYNESIPLPNAFKGANLSELMHEVDMARYSATIRFSGDLITFQRTNNHTLIVKINSNDSPETIRAFAVGNNTISAPDDLMDSSRILPKLLHAMDGLRMANYETIACNYHLNAMELLLLMSEAYNRLQPAYPIPNTASDKMLTHSIGLFCDLYLTHIFPNNNEHMTKIACHKAGILPQHLNFVRGMARDCTMRYHAAKGLPC